LSRIVQIASYGIGSLLLVLGLLGELAALLTTLGVGVSHSLFAPILVPPAFALYEFGVREPFVASGGGLAWLTALGVLVVYLLPGVGFTLLGEWCRRRRAHAPRKHAPPT
jgi:hypothetical protein